MELIARLERDLAQLQSRSLLRKLRIVETPCAPRQQVDGKALLSFSSNDYLGLASHPQVVAALAEGAAKYGAGSGASHLISGHSRAHARLEETLAQFLAPHLDRPRALYFCTGYMANLAMLTTLADKESEIFSESLNHASLIDAARLSRAPVFIYRHADMDQLASLLAASRASAKIIVTDSVFSMDGDIAPLPELLRLAEQYGAWLVVDDAHGFGALGQHGRGVLEHFNLRSPNLIYMGTLGKAAGVSGAFVAAHATVIEWLVQRARPYIYTTASPPALAHALLASLEIISGAEGAQRRAHLRSLIMMLKSDLVLRRWKLWQSDTAVQPLVIGANDETVRAAQAFAERGLWVPAIRPPTVPVGTARLRIALSAAHTVEDVSELMNVTTSVENGVNGAAT